MPASPPPPSDEQRNSLPWWRRPFSVVQTNLQEIDASLDVDAALDFIQRQGADTWLLNCAGIVSFYPTDLPFQTRSPWLSQRSSGDLVGDAVSAAHDRGVRVIARLDLSKVAEPIAQSHPDWLYVSPDGEPQVYNGLYSVCPSGEYYQQRSFDVLDEIMSRYPVDGFFFNWFNFNERDYSNVYRGICQCRSCRAAFAPVGGDLPTGMQSPRFWDWLKFSNSITAELTRRLGEHVRNWSEDAALILRKNASVRYHEAAHAIGEDTWHFDTSDSVSALVHADPSVPVMVNSVSFVDMPYRMGAEQPARFAQYLVQTIARGGRPSTYFMGAPGRIPYANLPEAAEVNRFYTQHSELYGLLEARSGVAVIKPDRFAMHPSAYVGAVAEFRGIYASLQSMHVPFDVIAIESIGAMAQAGRLGQFQVIVAPSPGHFATDVAREVDEFVRRGGHVVVTGSGGVDLAGRVELATSPAVERVGEVISGKDLWSTYATLDEQVAAADFQYRPSIVPVFGSAARYVWKSEATKLGHILPPAPYGPPEKCYGHILSDDPAAVRRFDGAGSVTLIPWSIGTTYREFGTDEVRLLFMRIIEDLLPHPLSVVLPEQVEVILGRAGHSWVIHLINMSGARPKSFGPPLTIPDGRIRWRAADGVPSVSALVAGRTLEPHRDGTDWMIELPPLRLFEVIEIRDPSLP